MLKKINPQPGVNMTTWTYSSSGDPKSVPADPNSRTTFKKNYRKFWKQRIFNADDAYKLEYWSKFIEKQNGSALHILNKAADAAEFEHKITGSQHETIKAMLKSPDKEDQVMAASILMQVIGRRMCGKKKKKA